MGQKTPVFTDHEWHSLTKTIPLSPRQLDISQCLFRGLSDKQIAQELAISISTVRTHLSRLFDKVDAQGRLDYVLFLTHHFFNGCRDQGCPRRQ